MGFSGTTHIRLRFFGRCGFTLSGRLLGAVAVVTKTRDTSGHSRRRLRRRNRLVILQVASFKATGKRVFIMAPIHHHFELKGWPEPQSHRDDF